MLNQKLEQKLLQKLSPQQIQLMKLLQVPTIAIEQRIKEELEKNPVLEEGSDREEETEQDDYSDAYEEVSESEKEFDFSDYSDDDTPSYKYSVSNKGRDDDEKAIPFSGGRTFHERLKNQLNLRPITQHQQEVAEHLLGNIDDAGYLRRDISAIVDDLAFTQNITTTEEELEDILKIIQDLDPAGVGARDLRECLLLQVNRKLENNPGSETLITAAEILDKEFVKFTKKHYSKIEQKLNISRDELKAAVDEILKLNPKPGNSTGDSSHRNEYVVPDFTVTVEEDELKLSLNGRNAPDLKVSNQYREMFDSYNKNKKAATKQQKDALMFVKQKLDSAKWFIDAINQRRHTLTVTMQAILDRQREYFLTGDETKLRPMILKDIAEKVHLDISTISRVVNSKYVETPYGTFLLKTFFSESLTTSDGEEVSTREVKRILQDIIDAEDKQKPHTDETLADLLREKGYNIARRTVAKYREQLNLPVARLRKDL